jgi:hypothetical protein
MMSNMAGKRAVATTQKQAGEETLPTKAVNSDHGIYVIEKMIKHNGVLWINAMRWDMPFQVCGLMNPVVRTSRHCCCMFGNDVSGFFEPTAMKRHKPERAADFAFFKDIRVSQ